MAGNERKKSALTTVYIATVIGCLEAFALYKGINGTCFAMSMAALAGIGGFSLKKSLPSINLGDKDVRS
jgi:hypothetical protein